MAQNTIFSGREFAVYVNEDKVAASDGTGTFPTVVDSTWKRKELSKGRMKSNIRLIVIIALLLFGFLYLFNNLDEVPSPYLTGLMDKFFDDTLIPMIQTTRGCPYTCTFCVSGKLRGKLRAFPEEQVFEEITFLSKIYADRPNYTLHIADENFGIFERDHKFAAHIRDCFKIMDYRPIVEWPAFVFFCNEYFLVRSFFESLLRAF